MFRSDMQLLNWHTMMTVTPLQQTSAVGPRAERLYDVCSACLSRGKGLAHSCSKGGLNYSCCCGMANN